MISEKLRIGLPIRNTETHRLGFVIDWGSRHIKYRDYIPVPAYEKTADAVRVKMMGSIEIWPIDTISIEELGSAVILPQINTL